MQLWSNKTVTNTDIPAPQFEKRVPDGDDRERNVCTRCGFIDYQNPKIVVGSVATDDQGKILLCKRAIEPRLGYWTLPAGYMELGETVEQGAKREAWEEAGAELELQQVLATYSVPRISQVQIMFRARLLNPDTIAPGPESQEIMRVSWEDIPWTELAFPTVYWALNHHREVLGQETFPPFSNPTDGV
ncbi:MAG: NUDIX hydrolase [Parvularculaceae bacterium]|nr:NUDIX hydrolase [Parvularculaceae bacterium]